MALHTKHPASAPPTAPARETTGHLLLRAWCALLLFTAFTAGAWNNLLGPAGFTIWVGSLTIASIVLWIRPARADPASRFSWRRLPSFPIAYVIWAGASLIWSQWRSATILTWGLLVASTIIALFIASMLTWRELVRGIASALKWVMGLSLLIELWSALVVGPILPNFVEVPADIPPELYWVRGNLLDGGRLQGIVGNAHLLGITALMAIIVFAIRMAVVPKRGWLIAWTVLSAYLFVRACSATTILAAVAAAIVLVAVLLMRTATRPDERTKWYLLYTAVAIALGVVVWLLRDAVLGALGRSSDLTGRKEIWAAVLDRGVQHPVVGWGYSTPWLPWDPGFKDWIVDHDLTVFMAHNMWIDVFFQLGIIGVVLIALTYIAFIWRSWFFAIDRPRWDLVAQRPYTALTLLPTLTAAVLVVQGMAESRPLMEWGWVLMVIFSFKIKQAPHIGVGPAEQSMAIERGEQTKQAS